MLFRSETPTPPRFDFKGFVIVGAGLALLELAIEFLGHRMGGTATVVAMFAAAAMLLAIYTWYALSRENPVLDLNLFRLRTFRASTVSGGMCRMTIGAVPFLLPLMLQVGFGLTALGSGLITFVMNIGAIGIKSFASPIARRFGFRNLVLYNASLLGFMAMGIALFTPETPHWVMIVYLLAYGVVRSIQFTNVNALGFADLTPQNLSRGNSISSVTQQLSSSVRVSAMTGYIIPQDRNRLQNGCQNQLNNVLVNTGAVSAATCTVSATDNILSTSTLTVTNAYNTTSVSADEVVVSDAYNSTHVGPSYVTVNTDTYGPVTIGSGGITFGDNTVQTTAYTGADAAVWGGITGTLSSQTDLQSALNAKYDASNPSGYITSSALSPYLLSATAATTYAITARGLPRSEEHTSELQLH